MILGTSKNMNWEQLKAELSGSFEHELSREELDRLFAERAESLAQRASKESRNQGSPVFRFSLGVAKFAVELGYVRSIITPRWITRIPGAPKHLSSVTHIGGRIVSLLELDELLEVAGVDGSAKRFLLLEHKGARLGVAATELHGIDMLDLDDLNAASQTAGGELLRGVGNDMTLVLDGARTISDMRTGVGQADQG
jgi:chemotaxis signal transduction protein